MNTQSTSNAASITQLILENRLETLLSEFDSDIVADFLEKALSDEPFGESGHYTFFCKKCGGQWSFDNKEYRKIFEKLHKFSGCSFEWRQNNLKGKPKWHITRGNANISHSKQAVVKGVIDSLREKKQQLEQPVIQTENYEQTVSS